MLELGVFHNGTSDRKPLLTEDGIWVCPESLEDRNATTQRETVNQVREGILADRLGFNYFFMTEHHFQPEGAEHDPNPLLTETAIAARTKRIRLAQMANIISWHHPLRIAEQAAMLDVLSGGRLEFGVGRGNQNRETESLGGPMGTTTQDQERNRAFFEEAYEVIIKALSQPSFSHQGEFFTLPPSYTKWNHAQTIAYFQRPETGYDINRALNLGPPDMYSSGPPVMASTTTLRELQLFPRPLQNPHPQVWMPTTSSRSITWAAQRGINAFGHPEHPNRYRKNMEIYYETCEKLGWPDRLDRGPFKVGWDAEKRRGYPVVRYIHIIDPANEKAARERFNIGLEVEWDNHAPLGIWADALADVGEDMPSQMRVTGQMLVDRHVALVGTPAQIVEELLTFKEQAGFEDFLIACWFETAGYTSEETQEQMRMFAAECMPPLAEACGGMVQNPEVGPELEPSEEAVTA